MSHWHRRHPPPCKWRQVKYTDAHLKFVCRREFKHGAAIVRPPGHHAESNMAMGFCFFNNAAIAARAAQKAGARKVVVLDWDIHHGNGTQHIFEADPSVLYISIHRWEGSVF